MTIYTPYFYVIQDIHTKIYYAGCKYGKGSSPDTFMVEGGYLTSSATVNLIIEERGLESFVVRKIKTFDEGPEALDYETRFLVRVNAKDNPRFYNKHNNDHLFSYHDEKYKAKMIEMYGVESPLQSKEIYEKVKATNLARYGIECPLSDTVKIKKTNLDKYGVENPSQSPLIKQRKRATTLEHYGVDHHMKTQELKDKLRATNLEKRGVVAPAQSSEVLAKMQDTCLDRYGVRNPYQSKEVKDKLREIHLARRGVEYPAQCSEVMEKVATTNMAKFGTKTPLQNEKVKAKMMDTFDKLKSRPNVKLLYRYKHELKVKSIPHYFYRKDDEWVAALLAEVISTYGKI